MPIPLRLVEEFFCFFVIIKFYCVLNTLQEMYTSRRLIPENSIVNMLYGPCCYFWRNRITFFWRRRPCSCRNKQLTVMCGCFATSCSLNRTKVAVWFHQYGATTHAASRASGLTSRRHSMSSSLALCDFLLWGYQTINVYQEKAKTINKLKDAIRQ